MFPHDVPELVCRSLTGPDLVRLLRVSKGVGEACDTPGCWDAVFGERRRRLLGGHETLSLFRGHDCACVSGYRFTEMPETARLRLPMLAEGDTKAFTRHLYETLRTLNHEVLPFLCDYPVWVGYTCREWRSVPAWHCPGRLTVIPLTVGEEYDEDLSELIAKEAREMLTDLLDDQASDAGSCASEWLRWCDEGPECPECGRLFGEDFNGL